MAYQSKLWTLMFLIPVGGLALVFLMVWERMPLVIQIGVGGLLALAVIAIFLQLLSSTPWIVADENGLSCYKPFYGTIAWEDVAACVRVDRVEKIPLHGGRVRYQFSLTEGWRPIDLLVRDLDKYSKLVSPKIHARVARSMKSEERPGCFRLRIEMAGATGSSEDLLRVIEYYIGRCSS